MNSRDHYKHKQQLRQMDIGTVEFHNSAETPAHLTIKALLALHLQRRERPFGSEVQIEDRGRVDVLDWGPRRESCRV